MIYFISEEVFLLWLMNTLPRNKGNVKPKPWDGSP